MTFYRKEFTNPPRLPPTGAKLAFSSQIRATVVGAVHCCGPHASNHLYLHRGSVHSRGGHEDLRLVSPGVLVRMRIVSLEWSMAHIGHRQRVV